MCQVDSHVHFGGISKCHQTASLRNVKAAKFLPFQYIWCHVDASCTVLERSVPASLIKVHCHQTTWRGEFRELCTEHCYFRLLFMGCCSSRSTATVDDGSAKYTELGAQSLQSAGSQIQVMWH